MPAGIPGWHTIYVDICASRRYPLRVGDRTSRLRQRLRQAAEQHQDHIGRILEQDATLIRGSFGSRSRVCGNPGCHCARGEKHTSKYLTATAGGKVRQVHVPAGDEDRVAAGVARYRRFRQMRKRLVALDALQLELVDELGQSLLAPYPPKDPFPPASRRGRKAHNGSRRS